MGGGGGGGGMMTLDRCWGRGEDMAACLAL